MEGQIVEGEAVEVPAPPHDASAEEVPAVEGEVWHAGKVKEDVLVWVFVVVICRYLRTQP